MKKIISLMLIAFTCVTFASCGKNDLGKQTLVNDAEGYTEYATVSPFDFSDYKKEKKDKAQTEGFVNVGGKEFYNKKDAKELALKELPEGYKYNTIKIAYDRTEGMWKVEFSTVKEDGSLSSGISVCIEETGTTKLIVKE